MIGADITIIQRHYFPEHRSQALVTFGMTQRFTDAYNRHYSRLNVWREHGRHLYRTGRVIVDPEMYPRALLKQCEFYNDCLLPNGGTHSLAGVVTCWRDGALMLTALRQDRKEGWEEQDRPTIGVLLPHLARARRTEERLQLLEAGEMALNALTLGALLLDAEGSVVFFNRAAEQALVHDRDGLSLCNGHVTAGDPAADAALQRLIVHAIAPDRSLDVPPDVLVRRPSLRRPYFITASPLRRSPRPFIGMARPVALVIVRDPEAHRTIAAEALIQGYGLTPREAGLAVALADGHTVEQAAEQLAMRYETARTHLRRILSKTQTSRQAELMKLLARLSR